MGGWPTSRAPLQRPLAPHCAQVRNQDSQFNLRHQVGLASQRISPPRLLHPPQIEGSWAGLVCFTSTIHVTSAVVEHHADSFDPACRQALLFSPGWTLCLGSPMARAAGCRCCRPGRIYRRRPMIWFCVRSGEPPELPPPPSAFGSDCTGVGSSSSLGAPQPHVASHML